MGKMTKSEIISCLVKNRTEIDRATQYADVYLEYQEATENIERNGLIVAHPRTGQPMQNPYLTIRDGALKKLQGMREVNTAGLWKP